MFHSCDMIKEEDIHHQENLTLTFSVFGLTQGMILIITWITIFDIEFLPSFKMMCMPAKAVTCPFANEAARSVAFISLKGYKQQPMQYQLPFHERSYQDPAQSSKEVMTSPGSAT